MPMRREGLRKKIGPGALTTDETGSESSDLDPTAPPFGVLPPSDPSLGLLTLPAESPTPTAEEAPAPVAYLIASAVPLGTAPSDGIGVAAGDTFKLHSLPGSPYRIYLDFDGNTALTWRDSATDGPLVAPAYSQDVDPNCSAAELASIQRIWRFVAENFSPFNIDVTTEDPGTDGLAWTGAGDVARGARVVFTVPWSDIAPNVAGVAHMNGFNRAVDDPVFIFVGSSAEGGPKASTLLQYIAGIAAHEAGHALGLDHDGGPRGDYYTFLATVAGGLSWSPFVGYAYGNILHWSKGEYYGATTTEDDLAITTTRNNGVTWRTDDAGDTVVAATALGGTAGSNGVVTVQRIGVISGSGRQNDVDVYDFDIAEGGSIHLEIKTGVGLAYVSGNPTPIWLDPVQGLFGMLDPQVTLYRGDTVVQVFNPTGGLHGASIMLDGLQAGHYSIAIDGVGYGNPMNPANTSATYTEYGSLGQYAIIGSYTPPQNLALDHTAITLTEAGGSAIFTVRALNVAAGISSLTVTLTGLDATEAKASATTLVLDAAHGWSATLTLTGLDDRDVDGNQVQTLTATAAGLTAATAQFTTIDDDIAATAYRQVGSGSVDSAAFNAADGVASTTAEKLNAAGRYILDQRWTFDLGVPGDGVLHIKASGTETTRLQESTDGGATWQNLRATGAPAKALARDGDYLIHGVTDHLIVRLVDIRTGTDTVQDHVSVDLMTVTPDHHLLRA